MEYNIFLRAVLIQTRAQLITNDNYAFKQLSEPVVQKPEGGGGGTLVFSYISRLGSFFGVQNFEFQYFLGFSEK